MLELIVMNVSLIAAIVAIADFFKSFIKYKVVVFILAILLSLSANFQLNMIHQQNSKELVVSEMRKSAKVVADSILITGWEETGDYLGYLAQITGFYVRYKDFYPIESDTYQNELKDWRDYFSQKRKANQTIYMSEIEPLKGIVKSGEEHLIKISEENS